jgi:mevalonate kinase
MGRAVFEARARGKFLLTGEYFVLDGAEALALPLRFGQTLRIEADAQGPKRLHWQSLDPDGTVWFEGEFQLPDLQPLKNSDAATAQTLSNILQACYYPSPPPDIRRDELSLIPSRHSSGQAIPHPPSQITAFSQTDFPREWGLGTSSTLIALLARWAGADPYRVLAETLGGSGYDIACAFAEGPILFQRHAGEAPAVKQVDYRPDFSEHLYFVFLGKKQNSREGIAHYRQWAENAGESAKSSAIERVTGLTRHFLSASSLGALEAVLAEHESLVSETLSLPKAKDQHFPDFWGQIKSLGAWGGDFVLATSPRSEAETRAYFAQKGFPVLLTWQDATSTGLKSLF